MIRLALVWLFVAFLGVYAWRDWFKATCGLVLMIAVVEHPDFPKSVFGIQGMNPWNVALMLVIPAWLVNRKIEGNVWDLPSNFKVMLFIFFSLILISFIRLTGDTSGVSAYSELTGGHPETFGSLFSEHVLNCIKWLVPAAMIFDGARTDDRLKFAGFALLGVYFLLAVQVVRWMPFSSFTGGSGLEERSLKILSNEIGFHRVNMSAMLSGASWAVICFRQFITNFLVRNCMLGVALCIILGQALTGGRMGYVTWAAIAFFLGALKWRKLLVLAPIAGILIIAVVPAARERLFQGFDEQTRDTNSSIEEAYGVAAEGGLHWYTITSGRSFAWPFVFEKILERPILGWGREGMKTSGVAVHLVTNYGEVFPHPHNAYLQWILDNGILATIPIFWMWWLFFWYGVRLFRSQDPRESAFGGIALCIISALLIASIGSQTFYPREGAVPMWVAIALMMRVKVGIDGGIKEKLPKWGPRRRIEPRRVNA